MKVFIVILLFGLVPLYTTLNCYLCVSSSGGCNDPFNATGSGVSTTGNISADTYCMKVKVSGVVARSGVSSCVAVTVSSNTLTTCCQTDLCNEARSQYQTSMLLALSVFVTFIKFKCF